MRRAAVHCLVHSSARLAPPTVAQQCIANRKEILPRCNMNCKKAPLRCKRFRLQMDCALRLVCCAATCAACNDSLLQLLQRNNHGRAIVTGYRAARTNLIGVEVDGGDRAAVGHPQHDVLPRLVELGAAQYLNHRVRSRRYGRDGYRCNTEARQSGPLQDCTIYSPIATAESRGGVAPT